MLHFNIHAFPNYCKCRYGAQTVYYFFQEAWLCSDSKRLCWYGNPPDPFKILLYYPETDTFLVSGIYEGYAFDSYFSVNMKGIDISAAKAQEITLIAKRNYDFTGEVIAMIFRIVATILIEVGIAYIFGFRQKRQHTLLLPILFRL